MDKLSLTLSQVRSYAPCDRGWNKFLESRGFNDESFDNDHRFTLGDVAFSNGAADAWWCVRCLDWSDVSVRRSVISALMPAVKRASQYTSDQRVHDCIVTIDRWLSGEDVNLEAAARAARAARPEAWAAWEAAWAAAWAAAAATAATAAAARSAELAAARAEAAAAWAEAEAAAEVDAVGERTQQANDLINAFGRTPIYA